MNVLTPRTKLGLEIAAAGLVAGVAGDALLRAMPWGLNATIGTVLLIATGAWLVRRNNVKPGPDTAWLAITLLLLGIAFLRRDSQQLAAFDMLAMVVTLCLTAASLQGEWIADWYPFDYVRGVATGTFSSAVGSILLMFKDVQWQELPQDTRTRHVRGALLGVLIAAPLLVVFAALFASADPVFNNVLSNLFAFDTESVIQNSFFFVFWGALTAGYLRWALLGRPVGLQSPTTKPIASVVPLATALGLLNFLFLTFVVVQLRYFFGGTTLVEQTSGLTFAEYAREGFFQLVVASGLVLPILLGADHLVRAGTAAQVRVFRQLAGLLLVLLAIIMASALQRMRLYVSAYGLTDDRLYATAFMILLVGTCAWFAGTVLRGVRQRFAFGALMQAFAVLAGLHILNPNAFTVRTNLARPVSERPFDAAYATTLGADAVPPLLDAFPRLAAQERCTVATNILKRWGTGEEAASDWRTWNWSRARARRRVREQANLLRSACPTAIKETSNDH
ncbi:MAG: DUF4153 domain-containing protein [Gemmatimonadales bacterium]